MRVAVAAVVAAAVAATLIAIGVLGSEAEPRLAGTNGIDAGSFSIEMPDGQRHCQRVALVPRHADRVRMTIGSYNRPMPAIELTVHRGGADGPVLTRAVTRPPQQGVVVLDLGRTTTEIVTGATLCVRPLGTAIALGGFRDDARIEWLRPGDESLFAIAGTILHRFGIGKPGWMGGWTLALALALAAAAWGAAAWLLLRLPRESGDGRGIPRAAKACALVALLNGVAWALLIPPYHVPDEVVHVAYTQHLAETGRLPLHREGQQFSSEQTAQLGPLDFWTTIGNAADKPPWSVVQQRRLEQETRDRRRDDGGFKTVATNHPPLYYAVEAVAYHAAPGAGLLTRLYLMRLASALMAAATVLCVFLFLRELLPGTPWAWTVGALAVAFQPMFGFESGGVNNDNLLYLASAALFLTLARAFRRGLTVRRAAAIGLALGLGLVSKLTMVAFVPATGLALLWLAWRDRGALGGRRRWLRAAAVGVAVAAAPFALYTAANTAVWDRPVFQGAADGAVAAPNPSARPVVLREEISYTWQLFLPRLPFMSDTFPAQQPIWDTWFTGLNGRFGWLDYAFPPGFYTWIWWLVFLPILVLAGRALWLRRAALPRRLPELAVYSLLVLGLVLVIARPSYREWIAGSQFPFYQPRYLLPLLPLYGAIVALAVRGAGRRAGPLVGTAIVMLAAAHTLFAQLLTITRYYA